MLPVESLLEFLVIFLTFIMHSTNTALNLFHRGGGGDIRSVAVFLLLIQTIGFTGQFNTFFLSQSVALY